MFECYALSSLQINDGQFHFDCEEGKWKKTCATYQRCLIWFGFMAYQPL